MQESKSQKKRRLSDRERRRIETIKQRHGADFFHRNAKKAGKMTPTKFDSATGSAAAKARWARVRESREEGK
jgi:hypothetical protein